MEIKTLKELREVLNYERSRWKIPQINGFFGWMKADLMMLFLHPGSPYQMMYCIRCMEYFGTRKSVIGGGKSMVYKLLQYRHKILMFRTQMDFYPGVADIGFKVNHGKCIVSKSARIGRDSVIVGDVTIGGEGGLHDSGAPTLGERVFVSTGARIIGKITICSDVVIAANAVVVKDITEPGTIWGGVPAKQISTIGDRPFILSNIKS